MASNIIDSVQSKTQSLNEANGTGDHTKSKKIKIPLSAEKIKQNSDNLQKAREARLQSKTMQSNFETVLDTSSEVNKQKYADYSKLPPKKRSLEQRSYVRAWDKLSKPKK